MVVTQGENDGALSQEKGREDWLRAVDEEIQKIEQLLEELGQHRGQEIREGQQGHPAPGSDNNQHLDIQRLEARIIELRAVFTHLRESMATADNGHEDGIEQRTYRQRMKEMELYIGRLEDGIRHAGGIITDFANSPAVNFQERGLGSLERTQNPDDNTQERMIKLEDEPERSEQRNLAVDNSHSRLENQLKMALERSIELENQVQDAELQLESLRKQIARQAEQSAEELADLTAQVAALTAQLELLQIAQAENQNTIRNLTQQLEDSRGEKDRVIANLQARLEDCESRQRPSACGDAPEPPRPEGDPSSEEDPPSGGDPPSEDDLPSGEKSSSEDYQPSEQESSSEGSAEPKGKPPKGRPPKGNAPGGSAPGAPAPGGSAALWGPVAPIAGRKRRNTAENALKRLREEAGNFVDNWPHNIKKTSRPGF